MSSNQPSRSACVFCGRRFDEDGVLILSHFAGAAEQLKPDALLVNPYDVEEMADTIFNAFYMSKTERSRRIKRMRRVIREQNVFWWVDSFLKTGATLGGQSSHTLKKRRRSGALQSRAA